MAGLGTPAYIWSGSGESYYSGPGRAIGPSYYPYDPTKGSALVSQVGGMSFTLLVNTKASEIAQGEAMQSDWQQCGMNVKLSSVSSSVQTTDTDSGTYNLKLSTGGGYYDPYLALASTALPGGTVKTFFNQTIADLVGETGYTTNPKALTSLWARVYNLEAKLVVNIHSAASPNYYVYTKSPRPVVYLAGRDLRRPGRANPRRVCGCSSGGVPTRRVTTVRRCIAATALHSNSVTESARQGQPTWGNKGCRVFWHRGAVATAYSLTCLIHECKIPLGAILTFWCSQRSFWCSRSRTTRRSHRRPRHADGRLMRQYWIPACSPRAARTRTAPRARQAARREPRRLPRHSGRSG